MIDKMKGKIIIQYITYKADVIRIIIRIILDEDTYISTTKDDIKIFKDRKKMINMLLNSNTHPGGIFKQIKY